VSAGVGADVESICSKCGDVWHVVVAKVEDKIAKVQCKQCNTVHRHRPPGGGAAEPLPRARPTTRSPRRMPRRVEPPKPAVPPDLTKPARDYRPAEAFEVGERIVHVKFGEGVVQGSPGPGRIEVVFTDGPRVLAQAKPQSKLTDAPLPPVKDADAEEV